jgi:hypothetical protein
MPKNLESKSLEELMADADELIQQINSEVMNDLKEEHRLEFEKHAQNFKKIKSEVQEKTDKTEISEITSSADGMHEAILDIVMAVKGFKIGK